MTSLVLFSKQRTWLNECEGSLTHIPFRCTHACTDIPGFENISLLQMLRPLGGKWLYRAQAAGGWREGGPIRGLPSYYKYKRSQKNRHQLRFSAGNWYSAGASGGGGPFETLGELVAVVHRPLRLQEEHGNGVISAQQFSEPWQDGRVDALGLSCYAKPHPIAAENTDLKWGAPPLRLCQSSA